MNLDNSFLINLSKKKKSNINLVDVLKDTESMCSFSPFPLPRNENVYWSFTALLGFRGDGSANSGRDKLAFHFCWKWSWNYSFELWSDCSSPLVGISCWLHAPSASALIANRGRPVARQIHLSPTIFPWASYKSISHTALLSSEYMQAEWFTVHAYY